MAERQMEGVWLRKWIYSTREWCNKRTTVCFLRQAHYLQHVLWSVRPFWGFANKEMCGSLRVAVNSALTAPPQSATIRHGTDRKSKCAWLWVCTLGQRTDRWMSCHQHQRCQFYLTIHLEMSVFPLRTFRHATADTFRLPTLSLGISGWKGRFLIIMRQKFSAHPARKQESNSLVFVFLEFSTVSQKRFLIWTQTSHQILPRPNLLNNAFLHPSIHPYIHPLCIIY